jgi:hypothetical protein
MTPLANRYYAPDPELGKLFEAAEEELHAVAKKNTALI